MNRTPLRALLALIVLLCGGGAFAQLPVPGQNAMAVRLSAETDRPAPGESVTLALAMSPKPGWHGYWRNPGDAGVEDRIAWTLPKGVSAGPLLYPVPERLTVSGLMNYVYKGPYVLLADLKIPADMAAGTAIPIRARIDYLVCTDQVCVPEKANVALDLVVGDKAAARDLSGPIAQARAKLPKPLQSAGRFEVKHGKFRLAVPLPASLALDDPYFYPLSDGVLAYAAPQSVSRDGDILIIETQAANGAPPKAVQGVLKIGAGNGLALSAVPGPVPAAGEPLASTAAKTADAALILTALLGAVLGGLLLNIMPCVFPILSLKALSLAKSNGDERGARREALAYAGGVILVCLALGAVLLGLRAGGAAVGWAFQLQDPRVILLLLLLISAIALNLAGLFELPTIGAGDTLARSGGAKGAFWTGALAAFVATPCTGPFMGAALGAALILPTAAALAIFAGLGLGLALPFLLLGFVPALRRRLPRPGPWMDSFRRILAVPMLLTAFGLAWILGRQAGVDGMALGLAATLLLALALWWVGRRQGRAHAWWPLAPALLVALAAIVWLPVAAPAAQAQPSQGVLPVEPFSETRLAALRAEGRPVFVYFTADWCLTCKVNEQAALQRAPVARAFADHNVTVLEGDWTRGDAAIGRFLEAQGRSGVPLYLYYAPGKPPETLPQILTASRLVELVG